MKMCNATGNGICVNCPRIPPKINGYSFDDICREDIEEVLAALEYENIVCYNSDTRRFYEKLMHTHPAVYMDEDWEVIGG